MDKLNDLIKKVLSREVIFYLIFGVLTTIINIVTFYVLTTFLHWEENFSNVIAILIAVLTAYFTNRSYVFHSDACGFKERFTEFYKFMLGRAFTMVVEFAGFFLLFNILGIEKLISKTVITVIVIILNYFVSKFFAFKKSN